MRNQQRGSCPSTGTIILFVTAFMLRPIVGTGQQAAKITQLRVSANRRYLIDQNGAPFLMQGDAAWSLLWL